MLLQLADLVVVGMGTTARAHSVLHCFAVAEKHTPCSRKTWRGKNTKQTKEISIANILNPNKSTKYMLPKWNSVGKVTRLNHIGYRSNIFKHGYTDNQMVNTKHIPSGKLKALWQFSICNRWIINKWSIFHTCLILNDQRVYQCSKSIQLSIHDWYLDHLPIHTNSIQWFIHSWQLDHLQLPSGNQTWQLEIHSKFRFQ